MYKFVLIMQFITLSQICESYGKGIDWSKGQSQLLQASNQYNTETNLTEYNSETSTKTDLEYNKYLIGGKLAQHKQFPYQVALVYSTHGGLFCGGSIITVKHVITAAHCFCKGLNSKSAFGIKVKAGSTNYNSEDAKEFDLQRMICHPQYVDESLSYDIAMLAIKGRFVFDDHIKKIEMIKKPEDVVADLNVKISGWGTDSFSHVTIDVRLKYITTMTISLEKCKEMMEKHGTAEHIKDSNVCTYNPDQQRTCMGDSGGPVVYQGRLMAVVSWSVRCDENTPGVHTSVAHYSKWIEEECNKDKRRSRKKKITDGCNVEAIFLK